MTKYNDWLTEERLALIEQWAKDGLIDVQIAKNMGISEATFYDWKQKFPEFSEAVKKGKAVADQLVENALYKRAVGYQYEEETWEMLTFNKTETYEEFGKDVVVSTPETKEVRTKRVVKHQASDTQAAKFWLQNRQPEKWRDKRETELSGSINIPVEDKLNAAKEYIEGLFDDDEWD